MPGNRGAVTIGRDDEDNELFRELEDPYFKSLRNPKLLAHGRFLALNGKDDADNELDMYFNVPNNRGNFQVNDYTKTHDDDEFVAVSSNSLHLKKDEIDLLASILKLATQDKEGNVIIDGVKISKIPNQETQKAEVPKPKKFLGL